MASCHVLMLQRLMREFLYPAIGELGLDYHLEWKKARNTSLILPDVAMRIAEIKGISVEEVEKVTADNAMRLFGISKGR